MADSLIILHSHPLTREELSLLNHLKKIDTLEIHEIDLTKIDGDYQKVINAMLDADRVQVW